MLSHPPTAKPVNDTFKMQTLIFKIMKYLSWIELWNLQANKNWGLETASTTLCDLIFFETRVAGMKDMVLLLISTVGGFSQLSVKMKFSPSVDWYRLYLRLYCHESVTRWKTIETIFKICQVIRDLLLWIIFKIP